MSKLNLKSQMRSIDLRQDDWYESLNDEELKEFKNRTAAETFVRKFNERNNKDQVPDWYMFAEIIK